jgi:hypothetical protein
MAQVPQRFDKTKEQYGFWVKHAILESSKICSVLAPGDSFIDWSPAGLLKKQQILENEIQRRNSVDSFYEKLEADILTNGFLNPLLVYAGHIQSQYFERLPPYMQQFSSDIIACVHGASRLYYAHKHKLSVPCVVVDWREIFPEARRIRTEGEFKSLYKTPPNKFFLNKDGLHYTSLFHTHM